MGALPDRLTGFQHVADDARRERVEGIWGVKIPPMPGKHQTAMMHAMEHGELRCLYVIGENPVNPTPTRGGSSGCSRASTFSSCRTS